MLAVEEPPSPSPLPPSTPTKQVVDLTKKAALLGLGLDYGSSSEEEGEPGVTDKPGEEEEEKLRTEDQNLGDESIIRQNEKINEESSPEASKKVKKKAKRKKGEEKEDDLWEL